MIRRSGRRPATLKRVSAKRRQSKLGTKADPVYQDVDRRSRGLCELGSHGYGLWPHPAREHHHLFKPRAGSCHRTDHLHPHHRAENILHVCRRGHREFEQPYAKGRRVVNIFDPIWERYDTVVIRCADKWAARAQGA